MPKFDHNGRTGAFRNWVKTITLFRLRDFWRNERKRPTSPADEAAGTAALEQWADPHGELSQIWELEHDRFLLNRAMDLIQPEFEPLTWQAFRLAALEGKPAADVAAQLGLTANAVWVAKSRVLARLRQELGGLTEI